jgi:predicted DNA repair protein MutK
MSGGLLALLDDVAALAKLAAVTLDDAVGQAAKAGAKAAGVVIDDAAVTPRYVVGLAAERELPIVGRIAWGSLKNKIIYLLPAGLLLTTFAPWLLTPILMIGALYLCFGGYEKVHGMVAPHPVQAGTAASASTAADAKALEDEKVSGAIRTDMVLSAEIMAISLANIVEPNLAIKALVLAAVAFLVTAGVYGAVALIVKADDFGVYLAQKGGPVSKPIGRMLVHGMPPFLRILALVGTVAMLWVGGGILIHGLAEFGWHGPEHVQHAIAETAASLAPALSGVVHWIASAGFAAVVGLLAGAATALIVAPLLRAFGGGAKAASH